MKSLLIAAAVLAAAGPCRAQPGSAADLASRKTELAGQIDAWAATELPRTEPADQLTLRYQPRLDDIRARSQAARAAKDLEVARKDFEDWKKVLLREKFASARSRPGGYPAFVSGESERARLTAAMSAMMAQERSRQSVMTIAGRVDGAAADGTRFFDGGVAMGPAAAGAAPAGFADAPAGAARYEKVRRLLIGQGVDPKIVDAGIAEGIRQKVDPMIVLSVVWKESGFKRTARNRGSGATGLMQMMPDTAADMGVRAGALYDVQANLRAGVRYLKWIANDYFRMGVDLSDVQRVPKAALDTVLAAYNAGIGNVSRWLRRQGGRLRRIPFSETRDYVQRIGDKIASWL